MKLMPKLFVMVAALAVPALTSALSAAQNTSDRVARLNALAGDVRVSTKGGSFEIAAGGTLLHPGDIVKTGAGSHADIDLGGNVGIVQIAPRSIFVLDKMTITDAGQEKLTETQLKIDEGAFYAKINKLAKGSRYEIATPKGIAGIRGTSIYATADGQITVLEGTAGVAFPNPPNPPDVYVAHDGETVGPNDRPPHPVSEDLQRDIVEALRDAITHGSGPEWPPFVPPQDPFISTTLPLGTKVVTTPNQPVSQTR